MIKIRDFLINNKIVLILLFLILVLFTIFFICTHETDYIKKHYEKLHIVFGDFRYEYIGKVTNQSHFGSGYVSYNRWKIYFIDSYGIEKNVTLRDDLRFESQIQSIYMNVVERYLMSDVLKKYFYGEYYNSEDEIYDINTFNRFILNNYYTKKYDYYITDMNFNLDFNFGNNYNINSGKIKNYNFFNLTNINIRELIKNGTVKIHSITYQPTANNKKVLNDFDKTNLINYLSNLTSEINNIIEIGFAKYYVYENIISYEGKETVSPRLYDLEFNK